MDAYLELHAPDGQILIEDDDSGSGEYDSRINRFRLPSDGTYTIVAKGFQYEGGSYRLSLSCNEPGGGGGSIVCGQTVDGQVNSGDEDPWTFEGSSGGVVTIAMSETDGMDTYLELYGPDGSLLTEDDDSGRGEYDSRINRFRLPDDGTYTIVAREFDYQGGSYRLSLSCHAPSDEGTSIRCGQTMDGRVETGDEDLWAFEGSSGDVVTIAMRETEGMDTYLELYGPDGGLLTEDDDSGSGDYDARISEFQLPGDGPYTIVARGYDYEGGSYRLSLSCDGGGEAATRLWQRTRSFAPWIGMGCCCFSGIGALILVVGAALVYQLYQQR
jgi:predicted dehydrogenase